MNQTYSYVRKNLYRAAFLDGLEALGANKIQDSLTIPPYGLVEYSRHELRKLRNGGEGGVWRRPPSDDGPGAALNTSMSGKGGLPPRRSQTEVYEALLG